EAIDAHGRAIPGQRIVFNGPGTGAMRSPGIAALRLTGSGILHNFVGVTASSVANDKWDRIAVVGLPLKGGSLPPDTYDTDAKQGYEPPSHDGYQAAEIR